AEEIERLLRRSSAAVSSTVVRAADQLVHLQAQVRALSPQKTLDRGYAVVELANGRPARATAAGHAVVRAPSEAPSGTALSVRVAQGLFGATSTGELQQGETHARDEA
ncbi:MAG TPA: exodeoxyribonuclease VII large subunit, partial [Arthrobacter bacterium]|nr:exodeoxyribonuclease VII large subunit [Arthrobacter sp.]